MQRAERRRLLAAALAALACAGPLRAQSAFGLAELCTLLAGVPAGEARFTERRQVAMLEQTLVLSGRLSFTAPDRFVRETLSPTRERLAVDGNRLSMTRGNVTRTALLDATPEALVMVEAIRGTLTGNRATLERHFETQLTGTAQRWTLELVPRDARLRGQVASVHVAGRQAALREVRVLLADGDRSVMTIEPLQRAGAASAPAR